MSSDSNNVTQSPKVFLSYRRDDTAGHAGRLFDQINNHFGDRVRIFMDVDSIAPGEDFVNVIENAVGACEILIVVIGRNWLTATDQTGKRRLDNPEDFIRLEIATALNRNIRVIPVIVQDAAMPHRDQLPEALASLSRRNAIEVSDERWKYDVDRLIKVIEEVLGKQTRIEPGKRQVFEDHSHGNTIHRPSNRWPILAVTLGALLVLSVAIWLLYPLVRGGNSNIATSESSPTPVATPTRSGVTDRPSPTANHSATSSPSPTLPVRSARIQVVRVNFGSGWSRGFFTSKGYIIAMTGLMLRASDETTVTWSGNDREYNEPAQVVQKNDWIALLKLKQGLLPGEIPVRNSSSLEVGERVERFISRNDKTPGTVVEVNARGMKPIVLVTTKISARGEAGAPVIDSQGRIVAMVLGGPPDKTESLPIEILKTQFPQAF
jgi:hypothetical protein